MTASSDPARGVCLVTKVAGGEKGSGEEGSPLWTLEMKVASQPGS